MGRSHPNFALFFVLALLSSDKHAQSQDSASSSKSQNATSAAPQEPTADSTTKTAPKKTKKVWTNDNLADAGGSISVVGGDARSTHKTQAKTESKTSADGAADPRLISSLRQQLEKLLAQLAEVDRQLTDLKEFSKGTGKSSGGIQRNTWEYNTSSVDEQLRTLRANRNKIQGAIDKVYDDARRRGIEPGQLR